MRIVINLKKRSVDDFSPSSFGNRYQEDTQRSELRRPYLLVASTNKKNSEEKKGGRDHLSYLSRKESSLLVVGRSFEESHTQPLIMHSLPNSLTYM